MIFFQLFFYANLMVFSFMRYHLEIGQRLNEFIISPEGGTCHVCLRGCACHVFGSEISLKSHFLGSKICNMNFPIFFFFFGGG